MSLNVREFPFKHNFAGQRATIFNNPKLRNYRKIPESCESLVPEHRAQSAEAFRGLSTLTFVQHCGITPRRVFQQLLPFSLPESWTPGLVECRSKVTSLSSCRPNSASSACKSSVCFLCQPQRERRAAPAPRLLAPLLVLAAGALVCICVFWRRKITFFCNPGQKVLIVCLSLCCY